jgi:hypothetical protein
MCVVIGGDVCVCVCVRKRMWIKEIEMVCK